MNGNQVRQILGSVVFGGVLFVSFQNCAKSGLTSLAAGASDGGGSAASTEKVIGSTSIYSKIIYDPQLEIQSGLNFSGATNSVRLSIDVGSGMITLSGGGTATGSNCALDSQRLNAFKQLLSTAEVCEPGPMPAGTVSCLALALADIELSDGAQATVLLRPLTCNSGTFLCDGQDNQLRALLTELKSNPPPGC